MVSIKKIVIFLFSLVVIASVFTACLKDKYETPFESGYPDDVNAIIIKKCATAGCHNTTTASGGLDFSTYDKMLKGNGTGAVVVPFRIDHSTLLFFTNTDSTQGTVLKPTMPVNAPPLTKAEYNILKNWIANGAPFKDGTIPFSGNPTRKKFYVVNQGCDLLSVFDADNRVIMRYYDVGLEKNISETPHKVIVSPDGKFFLVAFLNADVIQMFSTVDESLIANIPIGDGISGNWNTLTISSDSKKAYSVDYDGGRIAYIDLVNKTSATTGSFGSQLHGIALNATDDTLYVTQDQGNKLYIIPVHDSTQYDDRNLRSLYPGTGILKIHEIVFSPDRSKYFISCQNINQVWAFNAFNNQLLHVFDVAALPLEMAFSESTNKLFVTCQEATTFADWKGALEVLDYVNMTTVTTVKVGWQPHGVAVDDVKGLVYVTNRNVSIDGPTPHHTTNCGRNGSLSTIDLHTLQVLPGSPELSSDPYQVSIRH